MNNKIWAIVMLIVCLVVIFLGAYQLYQNHGVQVVEAGDKTFQRPHYLVHEPWCDRDCGGY